jgi:F0F1-type ATP synthase assembly protein I
MGLLGAIGQQYMFLLLVLLFLGMGLGTWSIIQSIFEQEEPKGVKKAPAKTGLSKKMNQ